MGAAGGGGGGGALTLASSLLHTYVLGKQLRMSPTNVDVVARESAHAASRKRREGTSSCRQGWNMDVHTFVTVPFSRRASKSAVTSGAKSSTSAARMSKSTVALTTLSPAVMSVLADAACTTTLSEPFGRLATIELSSTRTVTCVTSLGTTSAKTYCQLTCEDATHSFRRLDELCYILDNG